MSDRRTLFSELPMRPTARRAGSDIEGLAEEDDDEKETGYRAFSVARGVGQHLPMLEFRFANGNCRALDYSLLEHIDFNPSQGLYLAFGAINVRIAGRNLRPLFAGLARHMVRWIREAARDERLELPESESLAETIKLEEDPRR